MKIIFRTLLGIIGSLLLILIVLIVLVRLPSVQNYITHKATAYISSKTHTRIDLKRLYIGFPKTVVIEGLYTEDLNGDTLAYMGKLEIDVDMWGLLENKVDVNSLLLSDLNAHIKRTLPDSTFNFDFFIKAFAGTDSKKEEKTDTTSSKWQIGVDKVHLENIRATFLDEVSGIDMKSVVGNLELDVNKMDIQAMNFDVNDLLVENTSFSMIITKTSPPAPPDTTKSTLPLLALKDLNLHTVDFYFANKTDGLLCSFNVQELQAKPETIDLNAQKIRVHSLNLNEAMGLVAIKQSKEPAQTTPKIEVATDENDHGWYVESGSLLMDKVNFRFDIVNLPKQTYGMDYYHMNFTNVHADIKDAYYSEEQTGANIRQLSLHEKCGLDLRKLSTKAVYDDRHAMLSDLTLITSRSKIGNHFSISYPSIMSLADHIGDMGVNANFGNCKVSVEEALLFAPMLKDQPAFAQRKGKTILINGRVNGKLKKLSIDNMLIRTDSVTVLNFDARINGLPDAYKAYYDVNIKGLATRKQEVYAWIPKDSLPVNVPQNVLVKGTFKGYLSNFDSKLILQTSAGEVNLDAKMRRTTKDTIYTASIAVKALDMAYLLEQPALGKVTLQTDIKGRGVSLKTMQTDIKAQVSSISLYDYTYTGINLDANIDREHYYATLKVDDPNIIMKLNTGISLVDKQESVFLDLNLEGADLKALKLTKENIRTSGKLDIDLTGKKVADLNGRVSLNKILIIKNDRKYRIDSFLVASVNDQKHSALKIQSAVLNADYEGTLHLNNLGAAVLHHLDKYINVTNETEVALRDTVEQDFTLAIKVIPNPILNEVFFPGLTRFNGADVMMDFDNRKQAMNLLVNVPVVEYKGNRFTEFKAEIHSDKDAFKYSFDLTSLRFNSVNLPKTSFSGDVKDNIIGFGLSVHDKDSGNKLLIAGDLKQTEQEYHLHFDDKPVFNNDKWNLPQDNYISFKKEGFYVHEFVLSKEDQLLAVRSEADKPNASIKILFKQFELGTFSQVLEDDTALIRGLLNGNIELRDLDKSFAFVSDLQISNLLYQQNQVGDLTIKADNLTANKYVVYLDLKGQENHVEVNGSYYSTKDQPLDFTVAIEKLNLKSIEGFTFKQIRRTSGYMVGKIHIGGSVNNPQLNGDLGFRNAAFNVSYINNYIQLRDEHVIVDPKGIYFRSFTVLDSLGQKAIINGTIYTTDFVKMKYDLTIRTSNFTVLNTTIKDNQLYFGHILLSSTIRVKGDESLPVVDADMRLLPQSRITVVVPSSKLSTDKGDGVVLLIDTSTTADRIMVRVDSVPVVTNVRGIDLNANIQVDRQTVFKLIVDRVSGDSLVTRGEGMLSFSLDPSGKQSLTGTYTLSSGSYNASFQRIVKRDFIIKSGSYITWNGSPLDATVDITAIYRTKTSPAGLMSSEIAGMSTADQGAYRKLLTFDVNMMMKGSMMRPDISFMIDMPDKDKNAFGGLVYSKISTLNNDPAELNKQVFGLLVLNKFIPTGPGTATDATSVNTIARNSVNEVLADQLNQLSGRYVKDVELNFDIQSNDMYSATGIQQNTNVNVGVKKEFYNSRVSVQVGGNFNVSNNTGAVQTDASSLTGDMIVEYKLTEDGRYRFKAFRDNQYQGIVDGMLYRTGVGLIFTRDYDTIKELLSSPKKEEEPTIQEEKK